MKIKKPDTQKGVQALNDLKQKSLELGKKTAESVQQGTQALIDKKNNSEYQKRLQKYNPLFPEVYESEEYHIPNVIRIVDDADMRDIDVFEGAIGWTEKVKVSKNNELEILCLFDEAVKYSGLTFIPTETCGAVYHVDSFDRNLFVRTDYIFTRAYEERIAELKYIAYSLGAKSCSIEIIEEQTEVKKDSKMGKSLQKIAAIGSSKEEAKQEVSTHTKTQIQGKSIIQFEGSDNPQRPELKWFANDGNITRLIDIRCQNANAVKSEDLTISGATISTMSQSTAYAIDAAVGKIGAKGNASSNVEKQAQNEAIRKFIFHIEF